MAGSRWRPPSADAQPNKWHGRLEKPARSATKTVRRHTPVDSNRLPALPPSPGWLPRSPPSPRLTDEKHSPLSEWQTGEQTDGSLSL